MDAVSALTLSLGVVFLAISWIVLLINSSKEDYSWGLCTLFLPPISYLYGLFRPGIAGGAIVLAIIGWIFVAIGI